MSDRCTHDMADKDVACADGMCPICLAEQSADKDKIILSLRGTIEEYVKKHHPTTFDIYQKLNYGNQTQEEVASDLGMTQAAVSKRQYDSREWPLLDALALER